MHSYIKCAFHYPPASKASMEVANLTERKNLDTPVYVVKEFVGLYVCPSDIKFDPNQLRTDKTEQAKKEIAYITQEVV